MSQPRFCSTSTRGVQRQRPPRRVTCLVSAREPNQNTKQKPYSECFKTAKPQFTEWCRNRGKEKRAPREFLMTVRHDQTHTVRLPKSGLVVFVCIFACFLEAAPTPIKHALRSLFQKRFCRRGVEFVEMGSQLVGAGTDCGVWTPTVTLYPTKVPYSAVTIVECRQLDETTLNRDVSGYYSARAHETLDVPRHAARKRN